MTGLDLKQFQGAYVADTTVSGSAYGIRADTIGTTSELLAVSASSFTTAVNGIYSNGVGGVEIEGNQFTASSSSTSNLPVWTAIWSANDNNITVQGNNITGSAQSVAPEFGVYETSGGPNGFPVAINGNTLQGLSSAGSVCLGNDRNTHTVTASGNTLVGCATNTADSTAGNAYADNTLGSPDQITDAVGDTQFPQGVQIGTFADPGSLSVLSNGAQAFATDSSGNVTVEKNVTMGGALLASGPLSGSPVVSEGGFTLAGNQAHFSSEEVVGGTIGASGGIVVLVPSGSQPPLPTGGFATLNGEVTCTDLGSNTASWQVIGHYTGSGASLVVKAFLATPEGDVDSASFVKKLHKHKVSRSCLEPKCAWDRDDRVAWTGRPAQLHV